MSNPHQAGCPHCGQRAPIVLRGIDAFCTVCGGKRIPFTANTLNLAGKPYKFGGIAAKVAGWVGFTIGTVVSASVGGMIALVGEWLAGFPTAGYVIGGIMWLATLAFSLTAIIGGQKLGEHGASKELAARLDTVRALAQHRGGRVTASEVAKALTVTEAEADAILTALAKNPDDHVALELDDDGRIIYLFGVGGEALEDQRWRIVEEKAKARVAADEAEAEAEALAERQTSKRRARR